MKAQSLKEGDAVRFSDGRTIELGEFVGRGENTLVFVVANEPSQVIRIPFVGRDTTIANARSALNSYAIGYEQLRPHFEHLPVGEWPIPRVLDGLESEYLIVERVMGSSMSLETLLALESTAGAEKALASLSSFAKETASIRSFGDNHVGQYRYFEEANRWILMDWAAPIQSAFQVGGSGQVEVLRGDGAENIFHRAFREFDKESPGRNSKPVAARIRSVVNDERHRIVRDEIERSLRLVEGESGIRQSWPARVRRQSDGTTRELPTNAEGYCPAEFHRLRK